MLHLLAIQRIGAQQFLDRADDGQGVGLELVGIFFRLGWVFNLHQVGRLAAQPLDNPEALQALGNELDLATFVLGVVNAHGTAGGRQLFAGGYAVFGILVFHKADAQHPVVGFTHSFESFLPRVLVHHHRLYLGRKERAIGHRQNIHPPGHHLLRQGEALAVLVFANVFGHVLFEFLK